MGVDSLEKSQLIFFYNNLSIELKSIKIVQNY